MSGKQIVSLAGIVAVGVGLYFVLRHAHGAEASADSGEPPAQDTNTLVTVRTAPLRQATLHQYIDGFGMVEPAPAEEGHAVAFSAVTSPVAGPLSEVKAWEGEEVKEGDLLFALNSRLADVAADLARKTLDRQRELLRAGNTSQKAMQDAQAQLATAEAQQEFLRIRAPLSGTVTRVNVHPGEAVDPTTILAEITDLSRLVITANVPEAEAAALRLGQKMEVQTEPKIEVSLSYLSPSVDTSNGTVEVRAAAPENTKLRPGQFVKLRIVTEEHANCLAAPAEAVVKNDEGQEVVAVVTNDEATQLPVTTGLRENGLVEVQAPGLKAGQTVVTVGAYGLPKQTKIQVEKTSAQ